MKDSDIIQYSEIFFFSIQGEGKYTGIPTIWLRLFACNLNCDGFGQKDPTDPKSYILPYKDVDAKRITMIEEIPVLTYGCDSSYSWAAKFRHLQHKNTAEEIVQKFLNLTSVDKRHPSLKIADINERHRHPFHLCFTGGEPLLKNNQKHIVEVLKAFKKMAPEQLPHQITFETNGTQLVGQELLDQLNDIDLPIYTLYSFSPKLFSVSGEPAKRALKPDIIAANIANNTHSEFQLKFVLSKNPKAWEEMESFLDDLQKCYPEENVRDFVYIMPVGADQEAQYNVAGEIADMAIDRGYKVSARVHAYLWNNPVGK